MARAFLAALRAPDVLVLASSDADRGAMSGTRGERLRGHGLMLAQDKAIAKKMFAFHGVRTPTFAKSFRGRLDFSHDLQFPVIVKPAREDGSIGIEFSAVM